MSLSALLCTVLALEDARKYLASQQGIPEVQLALVERTAERFPSVGNDRVTMRRTNPADTERKFGILNKNFEILNKESA